MNKELAYNFYNILAVKSSVDKGLHFQYQGNPNEPNIIFKDNDEVKNYVSKNLYIFSSNTDYDGELIIENECTCNYGKKIYLRFLLSTDRMSNANEIDKLFENRNTEINLNSCLVDSDDCIYTNTQDGILITFQKPLYINSKVSMIASTPIFKNAPIKEGFEIEQEVDASGVPVFDSEGNPIWIASGSSWMECDNVPIDDPLVPMYSVDLRRDFDNSLGNALVIYHLLVLLVVGLLLYFSINQIYIVIALLYANLMQIDLDNKTDNDSSIESKGVSLTLGMMRFNYFLIFVAAFFMVFIVSYYGNTLMNWFYSIGILLFLIIFLTIGNYSQSKTSLFGIPNGLKNKIESSGKKEDIINELKTTWKGMYANNTGTGQDLIDF